MLEADPPPQPPKAGSAQDSTGLVMRPGRARRRVPFHLDSFSAHLAADSAARCASPTHLDRVDCSLSPAAMNRWQATPGGDSEPWTPSDEPSGQPPLRPNYPADQVAG